MLSEKSRPEREVLARAGDDSSIGWTHENEEAAIDTLASTFSALDGRIYMNTASTGVACQASVDALTQGARAWGAGRFDYVEAEQAGEDARALFAALVNVPTECVALIPTASAVAGQVAAHVGRLPAGGNILIGAEEYTSALFPLLQLRASGMEVRLLPHTAGGVRVEDFAGASDANTRLIAVSAVQSATGYRVDLGALREIADRSGALLYVDAAQQVGALPLDAAGLRIDALAAPAHKFLLGSRGMGYAYFAPALRDAMLPVAPGWKAAAQPFASFYGPGMDLSATASRFDQSLAWMNALWDRAALRLLHELGFAAVHAHNERLIAVTRAALRDAAIPFLDHGSMNSSTIFAIQPRAPDAERRLKEAGVVASVRAGRVRLSMHLYNTTDQIEQVVALLAG